MRTSRFTDSQIMAVLEQNEEGAKVPDLCREHGMSAAMFYKSAAIRRPPGLYPTGPCETGG